MKTYVVLNEAMEKVARFNTRQEAVRFCQCVNVFKLKKPQERKNEIQAELFGSFDGK